VTDVLTRPAPDPSLTVSYGPLAEHVIDLWLPLVTPAPLVVLVHGGFWKAGVDRRHLGPMAHALSAAGYLVAVPEYRRAGMAEEWSGIFDDIASMFDQAGKLAEPHGADLSRIIWAGHSAGGHLVLWAAARPYFADRWRGECDASHIVPFAGCSSLRLCAEWELGEGAAVNLMGGTPAEVPGRYALADTSVLTPTPLPVTLVHGTADERVPLAMSQAFSVGRLIEVDGATHFDLIDPLSAAWPTVIGAIGLRR